MNVENECHGMKLKLKLLIILEAQFRNYFLTVQTIITTLESNEDIAMLKRISKKQIENLTPIAEGFKVVQYDVMPKHGKTGYGKKIVGNVYRCDGDLTPCKNGIHFCKNPADVFDTY